MKKIIALLLTLVMLLSMGILPASAESVKEPEKTEEIYVYTEADNALLEQDVFAEIEQVKMDAAQTCGGLGRMTEEGYAALVPQVMEKVEASATYVPGTLQRNGNFLVWQTTVGIPCCYSPRMEAELHNTENDPTPAEIAAAEARADAILEEFAEIQGGFPSSINIGLIQPYWESTSNYADSSFNGYSPTYKSLWQGLQTATGGQGIRYSMYNANVDNIANTMEQCGLVAFDSHGTTDYDGWGGDYVSQANSSYLCLITNTGVTSQDTQPQQGPYGTYYHCMKGSGYAYVDGTCIANHMDQNAPHSFLYMGICLGMATNGMEAGLRAKGVEAIWGYSQSVSFAGDIKYVKDLLNNLKAGDSLTVAAAKVKAQYGNWDPAYSSYSYSQAVANYVAFPIVSSSEDPYPGHGNVDVVQTVYSTWTLFAQFVLTAVSNNEEWGTVTVNGKTIRATPAEGCYIAGYEVIAGEAQVVQNGNNFEVTAEDDCTVQINFAQKTVGTVQFSVPEGVNCEPVSGYVGEQVVLPTPEGDPTADAHSYKFLGWTAEAVSVDTLTLPSFLKAGSNLTLEEESTTLYALYTYFVPLDGMAPGQFVKVTANHNSWAGEYVITFNGSVALDASGSITGNGIGGSKAAINLEDAGCDVLGDALNNVPDSLVFVVEPAEDGTFSIKMKEADVYLAATTNTNALNTAVSANKKTAHWTFSMTANGPVIASAAYPERTLQYNATSGLFRCYTASSQSPLTLFVGGKGDNWYTTEPKDMVVCEEHEFSDWTVTAGPTCTEAGEKTRVCVVCGFRETEELEALGHDFGEWTETLAPTCTEAGENTRTCSRCGETETEAVEALGHNPAEAVKENETEPSCTEAGGYDMVVYCQTCGEELSREHTELEASGHQPAEAVKENEAEPTCTEAGGYDMVVYCQTCGEELSREHTELEALGHAWDEGVVTLEPTYDAEGEMTFTCTRCGETRVEPIEKLVHDCPCAAFTDMPEFGTVEHDAIDWAFTHDPQITTGTSDTTFGPEKTVTRGQAVTFLWRAAGCPEPTVTEHSFKDVKNTAFYYTAMLWAVEQGITTGTSSTTFGPNKTCTNEQILAFIYRYMGEPDVVNTENPWTDVNGEGFSFKAIMWAVENGIAAPKSETVFGRKDDCTRAAIVTYLYRIMTGEGLVNQE